MYKERIDGTQQENQEQAIFHYREALKINTQQDFPDGYAMAQDSLGVIYSDRVAGDRRANLEYALTCHQRALQVFTRESFPLEYARCMSNLGPPMRSAWKGMPMPICKRLLGAFRQR